jgi:hypothetical protein
MEICKQAVYRFTPVLQGDFRLCKHHRCIGCGNELGASPWFCGGLAWGFVERSGVGLGWWAGGLVGCAAFGCLGALGCSVGRLGLGGLWVGRFGLLRHLLFVVGWGGGRAVPVGRGWWAGFPHPAQVLGHS